MGVARDFIFFLSTKPAITNFIARKGMSLGFAQRFIPGETLDEVLAVAAQLNAQHRLVSLNHLGEHVSSEREANAAAENYKLMLEAINTHHLRGDISVKLTQLGLAFDRDLCRQLLEAIVERAAAFNNVVEVDMEESAYTEDTVNIVASLAQRWSNVGVALQAYLYRTKRDLERLKSMGLKIRLVKGAYREPRSVAYQRKADVDENYRRLLDRLLQPPCRAAIATHDEKMLAEAQRLIGERRLAPEAYEFQMVYGIRRDLQNRLVEDGYALRIYLPFGRDWCPYFMRRLAERPANTWFVIKSLIRERAASPDGR